jgi:hypothetical protein
VGKLYARHPEATRIAINSKTTSCTITEFNAVASVDQQYTVVELSYSNCLIVPTKAMLHSPSIFLMVNIPMLLLQILQMMLQAGRWPQGMLTLHMYPGKQICDRDRQLRRNITLATRSTGMKKKFPLHNRHIVNLFVNLFVAGNNPTALPQ